MFCPKCKYEYRDGFYECADCNIPLVHELPEEETGVQFKTLKASSNQGEIAFLQSVFEAEEIRFHIVRANGPYGGGPSTLLVATDDYERASEIANSLTWDDSKL